MSHLQIRTVEIDPTATGTVDVVASHPINYVHLTMTGNITLTFSELNSGDLLFLQLEQDSTGGRTVTWPSEVKWEGGSAPTLTTGANAMDTFVFGIIDGNLNQLSFSKDVK